jgi:hypothetical protein
VGGHAAGSSVARNTGGSSICGNRSCRTAKLSPLAENPRDKDHRTASVSTDAPNISRTDDYAQTITRALDRGDRKGAAALWVADRQRKGLCATKKLLYEEASQDKAEYYIMGTWRKAGRISGRSGYQSGDAETSPLSSEDVRISVESRATLGTHRLSHFGSIDNRFF